MKRTLFTLLVIFLATACFKSELNTPGIKASGLSPKLPAPAYGELENSSKSLDYEYALANKSLDYEMVKYDMVMNYELKMNMAWQACLKEFPEESCAMIHGNWPYFMSYMGMTGYGYPFGGMSGFYPGCPYQDASYCQTWQQTQAYMQANSQLGSTSQMTSSNQLGPEYASTAAQVWSSETDEEYEKNKAELEKIRDEVLVMLEDMDERDEEFKKLVEQLMSE